jgi:hypothetical protein
MYFILRPYFVQNNYVPHNYNPPPSRGLIASREEAPHILGTSAQVLTP